MATTDREKFLAVCHFEKPGELFYYDSFDWPQTVREWVKQGAPAAIKDPSVRSGLFKYNGVRWLTEIRSGIGWRGKVYNLAPGVRAGDWGTAPAVPGWEPRIIGEDERTYTFINGGGQTVRVLKDRPDKMPMFVDWPVKDRATWKEYKKRLDPTTPGRWPSNWAGYVTQVNQSAGQYPICLQVGSFFGVLREWTGEIRLLYMLYDDPELVEDMMDTMLLMETEVVKRVCPQIKIDMAAYWEDMCYRSGPLISPDMFRRLMVPRYRKLNDLLHSMGVHIIFVDCDGNIEKLVPLWLECGVNYMWPLEVAAGNDALALRRKYGRDVILGGNIDKRALIKGKDAIREEVMSKVPQLLEQGGYIPTVDHNVPPDVTFENYCYYVNTLREAAGMSRLTFDF